MEILLAGHEVAGRVTRSHVIDAEAGEGPGDGVFGSELDAVVTCRNGASAYRVGPAGEEPLDALLIDG